MTKFTRRLKKNKKNMTIKKGGTKHFETENDEREGVFDIIENNVANIASSAATTVADAGLKIIGLERIHKNPEEIHIDENNKVINSSSGMISNIGNLVDKTGATIINNVNEVLGSDLAKETTAQAAQNTAQFIKERAEQFNESFNKPEVKAEIKNSIKNLGEIASIVIEEGREPFNKAVDVAAEATQKASSAAVSGAVRVGTSALSAVPYLGAVISLGKMVNDGSKAASAMVEAGSEATEAASDAFIQAKENVENKLKDLEVKKAMANKISSRTTNSIKEFENPITQVAGFRKSRRRLIKSRIKSKRVRF